MKFRFFDAVILVLVLSLTGFCAFKVYGAPNERLNLRILGRGGTWVYPLDRETQQAEQSARQIEIAGPLGSTVVEFTDSGARVVSSPCTNKICIASGAIHRRGQWIACLPNAVSLTIESSGNTDSGAGIDAAAW
jgi:hypothetical protein